MKNLFAIYTLTSIVFTGFLWQPREAKAGTSDCTNTAEINTIVRDKVAQFANALGLNATKRDRAVHFSQDFFRHQADFVRRDDISLSDLHGRRGQWRHALFVHIAEMTNDEVDSLTSNNNFLDIVSAICPGSFGEFSFPLPGMPKSISALVGGGTPIITYVNAIINLVIAIIVIIAVISMVVAGYIYMTAGGSGDRVNLAKSIIASALVGLVLALTAWILLNTINPQFASRLEEPTLPKAP